jgi:transposase
MTLLLGALCLLFVLGKLLGPPRRDHELMAELKRHCTAQAMEKLGDGTLDVARRLDEWREWLNSGLDPQTAWIWTQDTRFFIVGVFRALTAPVRELVWDVGLIWQQSDEPRVKLALTAFRLIPNVPQAELALVLDDQKELIEKGEDLRFWNPIICNAVRICLTTWLNGRRPKTRKT